MFYLLFRLLMSLVGVFLSNHLLIADEPAGTGGGNLQVKVPSTEPTRGE